MTRPRLFFPELQLIFLLPFLLTSSLEAHGYREQVKRPTLSVGNRGILDLSRSEPGRFSAIAVSLGDQQMPVEQAGRASRLDAVLSQGLIALSGLAVALLVLLVWRNRAVIRLRQELEHAVGEVGERARELSCIFKVNELVCSEQDLPSLVQKTLLELPNGWRFPELVCARIQYDGRDFVSPGFELTQWRQSAGIVVHGEAVGSIDLCYLDKPPAAEKDLFCKEERDLIEGISRLLGIAIGRSQIKAAADGHQGLVRAFAATMPDTGIIFDKECRFLEVMTGLPERLFRPANELLGKIADDVLPRELSEVCHKAVRQTLDSGESQTFEYPMTDQTGRPGWYEARTGILEREGQDPLVVALLRDVTDRRLAEDRWQSERDLLSAILDCAAALILVLDAQGRVVRFNRACEDTTGFEFDEVKGEAVWNFLLVEEEIPAFRRVFEDPNMRSFPWSMENRWRTNAGKHRIVDWSNSVLVRPDGEAFVVLVGIDVSLQRRAEKEVKLRQEQLMRADKLASLGTLVAGVAHEINNPNNFIAMSSSTLQDLWAELSNQLIQHEESWDKLKIADIEFPIVKQDIDRLILGIISGASRIERIVADLRLYSREQETEMTNIDLNHVVMTTLRVTKGTVKKATDDFEQDLTTQSLTVFGNYQRIEQVLINVIENACHAVEDSHGYITVRTLKRNNSGIIEVIDAGKGIPRSELSDVTDPFFTTRRDEGGTGLGLAISAGIMEQHSGSLEIDSQPGRGTTVSLIFPLALERNTQQKEHS